MQSCPRETAKKMSLVCGERQVGRSQFRFLKNCNQSAKWIFKFRKMGHGPGTQKAIHMLLSPAREG